MHLLRLNIRLLVLAAVVVALVVAAGSLAPRQTSATEPDPTGVFCGYLLGAEINGTPIPGFNGTVLIRFDHNFDPKDGNPNDVVGTAVAYTSLTETMPDCQTPQEPIPASVPFTEQTADRPTISEGKWDPATNTATWTGCNEDVEFAGVTLPGWSKLDVSLNYNKTGKSTSTFAFDNAPYKDETCTNVDPAGGGLGSLSVAAEGHYLDGPGGDKTAFSSDWDRDGCRDWDELSPYPAAVPRDPFNPNDCNIGGVAELPEVEGTPLEAVDSSGGNAGLLIAVVAAAATAGAVALGGAAWYARRRWLR